MSRIIRVGLYERVSTDEQALRGYSIEAQIQNLEDFCKDKGYKIVDHYTDAGVSGGKAAFRRPEMSRLLEDVEAGKIDTILFTKLDRWFRNVKEYFKVQEILERHHVEWKAIHEDYDTMSANGRMAITIFLAINQNEREKGSERVTAVFENKRRNKEACFGGAYGTYGFIKQKDETGAVRLVIDPEAEAPCREFWRILSEGHSVMTAKKIVNATFGLDRSYGSWLRTFNSELQRGQYKGIDDYCPAYIEPDEWHRIRGNRTIKKTQNKRVYLFTGLINCPVCGGAMTSNYKRSSNDKEYFAYRCHQNSIHVCENNKYVSELKIEKWLLKNAKRRLEEIILEAEVEKAAPKPKPKRNKVKINEQIRRLNVVYMSGGKTDAEYTEELADLKLQLAAAEREESETKERDLGKLRDFLETDFEGMYAQFDQEEKRQFWRSILDGIVVDGNEVVDIIPRT